MSEEKAWVLQAQQGNDEAFTALVEQYQNPVFNLCYRMLGEPELAEDAAQESFLRAYKNINRYDNTRPFATWLLSIAAHYCIDRLRRRKFGFISLDDEPEDDQKPFELADANAIAPEQSMIRAEERDEVHNALRGLDSTDRAAIILRYWYDFSEVEIAENLNLTVSAVKSRLFRARKQVAALLTKNAPKARLERMPYESPVV